MKLFEKLKGETRFLKAMTILSSGSFVALIVQALAQIVYAKIFTPEALGIYAFLLAVPTAFVGVVGGRFDLALVYEEDEENIFALVKLNIFTTLVVSTAVSVGNALYLYFFRSDYKEYIWLVAVMWLYLIAYGLTNMLNSYNNRYREYKLITRMHVIRVLAQSLGTLLLGLLIVVCLNNYNLQISVAILMIPYCLCMFCGVLTQGKVLFKHKKQIQSIPGKKIAAVAKKHIKQPLLSAPAIFANSYSYSLMTIAVEGFGASCAGFYSLSTRLLGMPISLISGNISKVYMEQAATEFNNTGKFKKAFNKTFLFLIILVVPLFFCMYYLAPPVCAWLFGNEWLEAGEYIKILAMMFSFRFVSTALSPGIYVCRKQQTELFIQVTFLLVTMICGWYAGYNGLSIYEYLKLIGTARSVVMLVQLVFVFVYSRGWGIHKKIQIKINNVREKTL